MRVLALTHRLPYAPNRGDRLRAYHVLQHLQNHADVELVSLVHDDEEASHVEEMREVVRKVHIFRVSPLRSRLKAAAALTVRKPVTHAMLDAAGVTAELEAICKARRPDVIWSYCSGMARFAMRPPLDQIPMVLDFIDVDSQKWRAMAAASAWPMSWVYSREAATLGAFEARAAECAAVSLVVNAREADLARQLTSRANVQILRNGVEIERLRPVAPPTAEPRVVFCGVMNYAPNAEGMAWFVKDVWPIVRASRPDASLAIVGPDPTPALNALCAGDPSIEVAGRVPDVRDWLWDAAVGIAPLHVARGLQNKALEAIAAGLPIVITDAVAGGLPTAALEAARTGNTPEEFASQVLDLLSKSPEQRRAIATSANLSELTWDKALRPLWPLFERSAQPLAKTPGSSAADLRIRLPIPHP